MDFTFQRPECGFRGTRAGLLDSILPRAALQPSRGLSTHPCPAALKTFTLRVGVRSPQALPIPSLPENPAFSPSLGSSVHTERKHLQGTTSVLSLSLVAGQRPLLATPCPASTHAPWFPPGFLSLCCGSLSEGLGHAEQKPLRALGLPPGHSPRPTCPLAVPRVPGVPGSESTPPTRERKGG